MGKTVLFTESAIKPAKLYTVDKSGYISDYNLKERNIIGRLTDDAAVDVKLNSPIVSRRHGEIVLSGGDYYFRDLGSANGTYVNGTLYGGPHGISGAIHKLENGDVLRVDFAADVEAHPDAVSVIFTTGYMDNMQWYMQKISDNMAEINIGRNPVNTQGVRFDDVMVSQNHASFFRAQLGWAIIDHNSTNGVFVNGNRITEPVYLQKFDVIRIVNMYFVFMGDSIIYQNAAEQRKGTVGPAVPAASGGQQLFIHITERSVWQKFKKRTLLQNINMTINSGEMVLILGGSGAGKTTFMNAVMGYEKADGKIIHGKTNIYEDYDSMKFEIGYVPQLDLLRGSDTVYDTLANAARMKLPKNMKEEARSRRIEEVLNLLGLVRERNSMVSKLSGGQRKRLSIAVEYISDPTLFFLDEPDSGLDGIMAMSLNENLRTIADTGKIIMVITHAPDRVAKLYNKVIVLAKSVRENCGRLAFYGSIEEALRFFDTDSLEGVVKRINRPDEGGDGKSDFYIDKYKTYTG
jgi:ABC-type multidrug transport system ATPase subunit/pSer/pThr/pTyr-binding forkhead associated (FHA) protein